MVRFSGIILLIFLLISQTETFAKNPPPGTGTSDVPANILIMLDNSGSMTIRLSTTNSLYYPVDVELIALEIFMFWNMLTIELKNSIVQEII